MKTQTVFPDILDQPFVTNDAIKLGQVLMHISQGRNHQKLPGFERKKKIKPRLLPSLFVS